MLVERKATSIFSALNLAQKSLHSYLSSPNDSLISLKKALSLLKKQLTQPSDKSDFNPVFRAKVDLACLVINAAIEAGGIYNQGFQKILYEAIDIFQQVSLSVVLGKHDTEYVFALMSSKRSCWSLMASYVAYFSSLPSCLYHGYFSIESSFDIKVLLVSLSKVGQCSMHYDVDGLGRVELLSANSLAWLNYQYPQCDWVIKRWMPTLINESSRANVSLSMYPVLFLSRCLPKTERYQWLDSLAKAFHKSDYKPFAECFSPEDFLGQLKQPSRLVPVTKKSKDIVMEDRFIEAFPNRVAGFFLACFRLLNDDIIFRMASAPICLGRDVLSYLLNWVETTEGVYVFDPIDCIGFYHSQDVFALSSENNDNQWLCVVGDNTAKLVVNYDGTNVDHLLLGKQVLLVHQFGRYYAFICISNGMVEAVCGEGLSIGASVKNLWFDEYGRQYIEPWLGAEDIAVKINGVLEQQLPISSVTRMGYYFVVIGNLSIWLEATLVLDVVAYEDVDEKGLLQVYGVQYFTRFLSEECAQSRKQTLIVKEAGGFVLEVSRCLWSENAAVINDHNLHLVNFLHFDDARKYVVSENTQEIVVNKNNIARFVAHVWSTASLVEGD